ncbi:MULTISPECIES: murein hydrolase activator EnvC family protein [Exiguobacterium]|uniref:Peptidoglycan DD-metalloendopeptidase family protein n=1 Tax=Exiguobacterium acetylicum TaxID=41170 RepID=A0ABX8GBN6_EXIAC|nr:MULTISPECIES: M23 family metallopeptidase [Exiguobacterium]QWB30663.1 peptidoglycan DD-metalloendopeptidase family protein [Exiguobacterium acetylicum]
MKKTFASLIVSALVLSSAPHFAAADDLSEQKAKNEQQQQDNAKKQKNLESSVNQEGQKISKTQQEVNRLDEALNEKIFAVETKDRQIKATEREIVELGKEIEKYKAKLKRQEKLLGDRLRVMQENDGNSIKWEEVIFGSKNVGDLVSRVMAGKSISKQDDKMITDYQNTQKQLADAQQKVKEKKAQLVVEKQELKRQQADLESQLKERNKRLKELRKKKEKFETQLMDAKEVQQILIAQEKAIAAEKAAREREARIEKERQAQAAREAKARAEAEAAQAAAQKAAEEQAAKEAAAQQAAQEKAAQSAKPSGSTKQSAPKPSTPAPAAPAPAPSAPAAPKPAPSSGGLFIHPTAGTVTQGYGSAGGENGYTFHNGIDFGGPVGTPIVAAATGTVITASGGGPYGNHVMIAHQLNGKTYTTVYAHMSSLNARAGQRVSQGQQIGALGSTGNSTGPHLHFEIHVGGYSYSATGPANSVNPLSML